MPAPITVNLPHQLGKEEARRRIAEGLGKLRSQMTGGLLGLVSFQERWESDRLHFEGGGLGQKITGRIDVLPDSVQIQLDLPPLLATIADRITGKLQNEGQKLLTKK
jgi:putative polyhydroxyalkanoic acid system protein